MNRQNKTNKGLIIKINYFLIIIVFLSTITFAQDIQKKNDITETIRYDKKERELIYAKKSRIIPLGDMVVLSPMKTKAAILHQAKPGDSSSIVEIISLDGEIRKFIVDPLDGVAIADDGRFAIFGSEPTHSVARKRRVSLYSSDGIKRYSSVNEFSSSYSVKFIKDKIVVFYAFSKYHPTIVDFVYKIFVFDSSYNIISSRVLDVFGDSFVKPILLTDDEIFLEYWTKEKKIKCLVLDYECETIKEVDVLNKK